MEVNHIVSVAEMVGSISMEYIYYPERNTWAKKSRIGSLEDFVTVKKENLPEHVVKFLNSYGSKEGV